MCDIIEQADVHDEDGSVTHATTVLDWVESCWRSGHHLDMSLVPGDGRVVRCHRLMLTSVSRLLADIIEDTEDDITIIVPDTTDKELEMFLDYIYTGKSCINSASVMTLMRSLQIPANTTSCNHHTSDTIVNHETKIISINSPLIAVESGEKKSDLELCSCPICLTQFQSKSDLSSHMVSHLGEFKCDLCQTIHPSRKELLAHQQSVHSSESPSSTKETPSPEAEVRKFKCSKCEELFRWRADLKKHCESVHNEKVSDLIPCSICNKLIVTRRLNEHIKMVHCNEKPLSCQ